jgi:uncharacterized Zn finger protein
VAALQAEEFFNEPSMLTLLKLQQAAEQAGVWPAVRAAVMRYLETGARPPFARNPAAWPLPEINLPPHPSPRQLTFPLIDVLIAIAVAERQPDQVLRWYDQWRSGPQGWVSISEGEVAEAVAETHPERALAIWRRLIEGQIAMTQTQAYEIAVGYLRKMYRLLEKRGRLEEWRRYVAELRQANARKRRLVEMLDGLVGVRR